MEATIHEFKTLNYKDKVVFARVTLDEFSRMKKGFVANEACFMFVEQRHISIRTPNQTVAMSPDEALLAKCGNYFFENRTFNPSSKQTYTTLAVNFHPEILKELFSGPISPTKYRPNYELLSVQVNHLLLSLKENVNYMLDHPEIVDDELIVTKLKEFLLLLAKTDNAPTVEDFVATLFDPVENDFKKTIESNLYSNLSSSEFAHLCGTSLATFKRKFETYYSESPKRYILNRKLERARELLSQKNQRIATIAYDSGFDSVNSFNRNFKTLFGQSPSEYRTSLVSQNEH